MSHFLLTCPKTQQLLHQSNPGEDDLTKPMRCMPPFKNVVANLPVRVGKMMPTGEYHRDCRWNLEFDWKAGPTKYLHAKLGFNKKLLQWWIFIAQVDPLEMTCGVQKAAEYCIQVFIQ